MIPFILCHIFTLTHSWVLCTTIIYFLFLAYFILSIVLTILLTFSICVYVWHFSIELTHRKHCSNRLPQSLHYLIWFCAWNLSESCRRHKCLVNCHFHATSTTLFGFKILQTCHLQNMIHFIFVSYDWSLQQIYWQADGVLLNTYNNFCNILIFCINIYRSAKYF